MKQLITHPLVLREVGSGLRHCFEKSWSGRGGPLAELRVALELGSNEAIKEAVLRGIGVAVLSTSPSKRNSGRASCTPLRSAIFTATGICSSCRTAGGCCLPTARLFLIFLETHPFTDPSHKQRLWPSSGYHPAVLTSFRL